jgi:hypothetical protein
VTNVQAYPVTEKVTIVKMFIVQAPLRRSKHRLIADKMQIFQIKIWKFIWQGKVRIIKNIIY